jgi:hypothetical protein
MKHQYIPDESPSTAGTPVAAQKRQMSSGDHKKTICGVNSYARTSNELNPKLASASLHDCALGGSCGYFRDFFGWGLARESYCICWLLVHEFTLFYIGRVGGRNFHWRWNSFAVRATESKAFLGFNEWIQRQFSLFMNQSLIVVCFAPLFQSHLMVSTDIVWDTWGAWPGGV